MSPGSVPAEGVYLREHLISQALLFLSWFKLQDSRGLSRYSTTRKPPQGAYHPGCPLLGLSPEEANINQCKHVRLNGLFIFPTTAVLMHWCLLTITLQGGWQHAFGLTAAHEAKLESCAVDQGRRRMGTNVQESSFSNYWLQETFLLCLSFPCKKKKLYQSNEFPGGGVHT